MTRWLLNINTWQDDVGNILGGVLTVPKGYRGKYRQALANVPLEHSQQWLVLWAKLSWPTQSHPFVHVRSVAAFPLQLQDWVISRAVTFLCSLKHLGSGFLHEYWPLPTTDQTFPNYTGFPWHNKYFWERAPYSRRFGKCFIKQLYKLL